jgi:glutamyl-tRNA synthetase/glutamyl-Q tRNA(Asp) synthetase
MPGKIRFAPSPTGYLHEGHLLSALYVWAASHKWQLKVHLRIEDHDRGRARDEYIQSIYEDLAWFGFKWDSQSIQSKRGEVYLKALETLEKQGLVYPCYCSRKQLEEENPKSETGEIVYRGKCFLQTSSWRATTRHLDSGSVAGMTCSTENNVPHNLRVIIPDKVIEWHDLRLGDFRENPKEQCGDFPIRDRDGQWTYQFAVCVDDIDEGITHVVRGEDIRSSTARQIALMRLLGRNEPPVYLHHPLIVDPAGKKLSKREMAHSLRQDRTAGATAEELLGRVCFKAGITASPAPLTLERALSAIESRL